MQRARNADEVGDSNQLPGIVKPDEVADPRKRADVGDAVIIAHDPGALAKLPVEHAEQTLRFGDIALQRAFVLVVLAGKLPTGALSSSARETQREHAAAARPSRALQVWTCSL
jgi:hypothetical protein